MKIINCFLVCFVFMISLYAYGRIIFGRNKKLSILKEIIIFIITCLIHTIISTYLDGMGKTIILCIMYTIFVKILFNATIMKALLASIIYVVLNIIPEFLTIGIATKLLNISKEYYYANVTGGIIGNIIVSGIMILISIILKSPLKKIMGYNLSTNKKIILMSILTILFIAYFFYEFAIGYKLNKNIIIYLITIFGFMIVLFTLFKQNIENNAISKKYDDLLNIMKNYESDIEEQRIMIHETRNELMTIKCKITDDEKQTEIIDYIDSILGDKVSSKMSKYSKFKYLPSNGIKGFFYYKFMEAEKRGIKVSVNISKKIENSFLEKLDTKDFKDLVRIIGVYLDNAIEASAESKDKKIGIEIYLIKKDIDIIISNTFDNEINKERIGKERFTTKGKNRGHGLLLVKHILKGNKIFDTTNTVNNNIYTQKLKIKNNKKTQ